MSPSIFIWIINALWLILVVYLDRFRDRCEAGHSTPFVAEAQPYLGDYHRICASASADIPVRHFFAPINPAISVFGVLLCVAGMAFLVWGRHHLGRNWSQTVAIKEEHELVSSDCNCYVRHPMYTGGLVACIGSAIAAGGAWMFVLLILGTIFLWRVGAEDKLMAKQFPNEYPDYKKRT